MVSEGCFRDVLHLSEGATDPTHARTLKAPDLGEGLEEAAGGKKVLKPSKHAMCRRGAVTAHHCPSILFTIESMPCMIFKN